MGKRTKAVLMLVIWIFSLFNTLSLEVIGAETAGITSIKNSIIELLVNRQDGRFAIRTVEGSPARLQDEDAPLLYAAGIPETTFATIKIDGKNYIYGNSYDGLLMKSDFTAAPAAEGMASTSTWKVGDIAVTQRLELTDNIKSSDVGNVKISYSITNTGTSGRSVGARILLDTMLGSNDGSAVSLDGKTEAAYESDVSGADIPVYWRTTDSTEDPKVVAYGFVKGWGNTEPDRMVIAHWNALSSTKWDYTVDTARNIGSSLNDYKSADSAVALYWEPETLEPNQTIRVETYYGLGNINESTGGNTFNLTVMAPSKLSIENGAYKGNPFDIIMELDNSLADSTELSGVTAELILPEGLELVSGQEASRYFYKIPINQKQTAEWKVYASSTQNLKVLQYMIRITGMGKELKSLQKFIIIPGFENNDYDIGYLDIIPRTLYYNDEGNSIQLIGYGFEKLRDKSSYEISLVNIVKGNSYYPGAEDITIVNDNQIRIGIPTGLDTGRYRLVINNKNDMLDYTLTQEILLTSDVSYRSRNYGILVIKQEYEGGIATQRAKLVESESQLTADDRSNAVTILRGKVRSISEDRFEVYGDGISINSGIYFKGYEDKVLSVYRSGNSYIIKGNGELSMQSALMGQSMEIALKKGHFYIDSATAVIRDEDGYINNVSTVYVGYFPILVKEIKLQNNGEARIDGLLKLDNKYFNFLTGVDTGNLESDLKDMSINSGSININTEITLPFPRWKLGDFQSKDYLTSKTTNVTFYINTLKGAYGFRTKAQNLKLRLRDINAKMAFDKNLYPDYFEFENKYGAIPEPIGSTGLAFESIGGGIYGLRSMFDSLRYGILPTGSSVVARADIVDLPTYNARIRGYTMIGLRDIEAVLNSGGIDLDGDGYVYFIDAGDIIGHFDFDGGYIEADIDILDILIGQAYFGISSHEIKGSVYAKVQIPDSVWFIGGETISSFKAGLSTKKIEGSTEFLGVGVGIAYSWGDSSVDFDVASMPAIYGEGIYTARIKNDSGKIVTVTYGENIEKLKDIYSRYEVCYAGDMGGLRALGTPRLSYEVGIDSTVESAIIEMKYTSSAVPAIELTDPSGRKYELIDGVNYRNQVIPSDISASGSEEKRLFVTVSAPEPGTWKVASDQEVIMSLYNAKTPAAFKSLSARQEAGKLKVDWTLNETLGSRVDLYLVKYDGASEPEILGAQLDGALGAYTCDMPSGVTNGRYKVHAEVKREGTGFDEMYSQLFEITDTAAPTVPSGFTVSTEGNGLMRARWSGSDGTDEYRIYVVDKEGNIDRDFKTMVNTEGDVSETVFGGTTTDQDGNEYGWLAGRTYLFGLYAVRKTIAKDVSGNDVISEHISKPAYSGEVYLPVPAPPVFTASFTSEGGNINLGQDDNGNEIRYVNRGSVKCNYGSDTTADVKFYVNGSYVAGGSMSEAEQELVLVPGSNLLEIEAVGNSGDKTAKAYEFVFDDKAPELMVQSPNSNDNIKAGTIPIIGRTTADCKLYVNGTQLDVSEDGSFSGEYMLSSVQRETIKLASVDLAGNETEYAVEILNSEAANLLKVRLLPEIQQLRTGDSIQMRLYGVTKDGKEILLGNDKVDWQLYDTEEAAALTGDGLLTGVKAGEAIVSGRYELSGGTAFEDALIIKVLPKAEYNSDDEGDKDDDRDTRRNTANLPGILKKSFSFLAGEEIDMPGMIKLRFTGNESVPEGSIEVFEIRDVLKYRQMSGNKDFISNIFEILLPDGYRLSSPVELTICYDRNKVKNPKHIAIYVFNEKKDMWDLVGGTVDEQNAFVTVKILHFSKYAVMENSRMVLMADVERHWARDSVYRLIDRGIINGIKIADGEYRYEPEKTVTRAEFAKLLSLAAGYREKESDTSLTGYKDSGDIQPWAVQYLRHCIEKGWIKGKAEGSEVYMKPNDSITRAEAAAMISRSLELSPVGNGRLADFSDRKLIPSWAAGYIDRLQENKLMLGYSDGSFMPYRVLTRAEAAKIFDEYVYGKENGF